MKSKVFITTILLGLVLQSCVICGPMCPDNMCGDHGECVEGDCVCDDGYEGVGCDTYLNAKFDGHFGATTLCMDSLLASPDSVAFIPRPNSKKQFHIVGLWQSPSSIVLADVNWDGVSFDVPRQPISPTHDIATTSAYCNADGTQAQLHFNIYDHTTSAITDSCTVVLSR